MVMRLKNVSRDEVLATHVKRCTGYFDRLKGLLGTPALGAEEACWIDPCNSIHTIGMQYPIDVYFWIKQTGWSLS